MQLARSAYPDTFCRDNLPPQDSWPEMLSTLPELAYPERLNCAVDLLDGTITRHGADRPCLRGTDGTVWSYGELRDRADRIAAALTGDLGLVPGNRVLLLGPNNPELVACWFGILRAGGVVVACMPLLRAGELRTVCDIAKVDLVLVDHRFTAEFDAAAIGGLRVVTYGTGNSTAELDGLTAGQPAGFTPVDTAADDVALLAFTSGTTGVPKATMHFHRDVLAICDTFSAHLLRPEPDDVFIGTPPLAFTFGLGGLVLFPLRVGASTLLVEKAGPAELVDHIARHRVSICFTSPTAYRAMLATGRAAELSTLRRCVSAGEHLPASVWHSFHEATGVKIIDGIGSTEMLHIFVSAADDDIRPGATGKAVPGYVATVLDADGNEVPDGTPGRLAVKGPTGCRYLADDRQSVYVQHGWNITGDTYLRDEDGYFFYQARTDDMIISSGYNIAGPEVEEAILAHPEVAECGVIGTPDEMRGSLVTAFVVLADGVEAGPAKAKELQDFVKARIAPYKYPRRIEFVQQMPRTNTGKLQRFRLRELIG
jgi:2-aminobenzoate-CoA ligase